MGRRGAALEHSGRTALRVSSDLLSGLAGLLAGGRAALMRKFGSEPVWRAFYGGAEGEQTLLDLYRADLKRALAWGARYVVFHVSDVSIEEGYTYRWEHSHAGGDRRGGGACQPAAGRPGLAFSVPGGKQWWPGFTFTDPALTGSLLEKIHFARKGILLDTGHLMNTDREPAYPGGGGGLYPPYAGRPRNAVPVYQGRPSASVPQRSLCPCPHRCAAASAGGLSGAVCGQLPPYFEY